MNTVALSSPSIVSEFPLAPRVVRELWRQATHAQHMQAEHMIVRNFLLGYPLKRGFTPISNTIKLANGQAPWGAWSQAFYSAQQHDRCWEWLGDTGVGLRASLHAQFRQAYTEAK